MFILCHSHFVILSLSFALVLFHFLSFVLSLSFPFSYSLSYHLINYVQSHKQQTEEPNYIM